MGAVMAGQGMRKRSSPEVGVLQQVTLLVPPSVSPDLFLRGPFHLTIHLMEYSFCHLDRLQVQEHKREILIMLSFWSSFFWLLSGLRDIEDNGT